MTNQELRIKVAEARGWDVYDREEYPEYYPFEEKSDLYGCFNDQKGEVPKYYTSMDACMELLKEMMDNGSLLKIYGLPNLEDQFYVSIYNAQARELITNMMSDYLPVAICKAYLAWKGEQ